MEHWLIPPLVYCLSRIILLFPHQQPADLPEGFQLDTSKHLPGTSHRGCLTEPPAVNGGCQHACAEGVGRRRLWARCVLSYMWWIRYVNTYNVAGVSRRQDQNVTNLVKNVKIVEFHNHIRNSHEKCIQISTNMPNIGLVIPEITFDMLEFRENKHNFAQ